MTADEVLLKLYPNGFLQRAKRAQFLGSDQRQRHHLTSGTDATALMHT